MQSIGQGGFGKQGVDLAVTDTAKLCSRAVPSAPGLWDKVMDCVPVDHSLAKLTRSNCVSGG